MVEILLEIKSTPTQERKNTEKGNHVKVQSADSVGIFIAYQRRMSLRTALTEWNSCPLTVKRHVFYSCLMSVRTASTELKCCKQGDIFHNSILRKCLPLQWSYVFADCFD